MIPLSFRAYAGAYAGGSGLSRFGEFVRWRTQLCCGARSAQGANPTSKVRIGRDAAPRRPLGPRKPVDAQALAALAMSRLFQSTRKAFISVFRTVSRAATPLYFFATPAVLVTAP